MAGVDEIPGTVVVTAIGNTVQRCEKKNAIKH